MELVILVGLCAFTGLVLYVTGWRPRGSQELKGQPPEIQQRRRRPF